MNFDFTEGQNEVRDRIVHLFDAETLKEMDDLGNAGAEEIRTNVLRCLDSLAGTGYLDPGDDEGGNSVELNALRETLAILSPSLYLTAETSTRLFGRLVSVYGSPEQKEKIIPAVKEGRAVGAVGLTEENMSLQDNPLKTRGTALDDGFSVTGSKPFVVNGPIADWIAVAGTIHGDAAFFLMENDLAGLHRGPRIPAPGYKGTPVSGIVFEACPVASARVIGPFHDMDPFPVLRKWEDQILAVAGVGVAHRAYHAALEFAKKHTSGGKPIIAHQEVGFKLAEMLTLLQTSRLLAYRSAWMAETGERDADALSHCAKVFCAETAEDIASMALQVMGAGGYFSENPALSGYREAKYLQIAGTSSEISRMEIAEKILAL